MTRRAITERLRLIRPAIAGSASPAEFDISNRRCADGAWLRLSGRAGITGLPSPLRCRNRRPQIGIPIEGIAGQLPTALSALGLDDALVICDKLNPRIDYNPEAWPATVPASMRTEDGDPDGGVWH